MSQLPVTVKQLKLSFICLQQQNTLVCSYQNSMQGKWLSRRMLLKILNSIRFLARQALPLWGHCDDTLLFENLYINRFSGAKRQKVQSIHSFMYIPLFDILSQLFQNKGVLRAIHTVRPSDSMLLKDYSDGSL